jgi:hypothetical protein
VSSAGWWLIGATSVLLVLTGVVELFFFFLAPWPAMIETEKDLGVKTPNKSWIVFFMFVRPSISVLLGLGTAYAAFSQVGR